MPRKYRDERNSRRNRRWLQDELEASGFLPDTPPTHAADKPEQDVSPAPPRRPHRRPPDHFIPFREIAAQSDRYAN